MTLCKRRKGTRVSALPFFISNFDSIDRVVQIHHQVSEFSLFKTCHCGDASCFNVECAWPAVHCLWRPRGLAMYFYLLIVMTRLTVRDKLTISDRQIAIHCVCETLIEIMKHDFADTVRLSKHIILISKHDFKICDSYMIVTIISVNVKMFPLGKL